MKPGATTSPFASMVRFAFPSGTRPTATILSPLIATSPTNHGLPVPSTTRPFAMTRSYSGTGSAAGAGTVNNASAHGMSERRNFTGASRSAKRRGKENDSGGRSGRTPARDMVEG